MNTRLFLGMLLAFSTIQAQLPTDQVASYDFTNGSLVNNVDPGNGDLSGATPTSRIDRYNVVDNAIHINTTVRTGYELSSTGNSYTVSFWFHSSFPTVQPEKIIEVVDAAGNGFYLQKGYNQSLFAGFKNANVNLTIGDGFVPIYDGTASGTGSWHHIALVVNYDATTGYTNNVYLDGVHNALISNGISTTDTSSLFASNADFKIGAYVGGIDDISIFERALSTAELHALRLETYKIYVNASATGNNDGLSWDNAFNNVEDGLLKAAGTKGKVWIAKGTYKPAATDRDASFVVNSDVYGGFNGLELELSDRNMSLIHTTNATVLSGDLLGDDDATVDFNDTTRDDNSKHVVEIATDSIEINGLIIQDGYADATSGDDRFGAGIFNLTSIANFTLKNSIIKNNVAYTGAGLSYTTFAANSSVIIDACVIENNLANTAAGLDFHHGSGNASIMNVNITNTLFKKNKTDDDIANSRDGAGGAAVRLRAYWGIALSADLVNNTFVNNTSLGSEWSSDFPVVEISRRNGQLDNFVVANNIFWGNTANGGAISPAIGRTSSTYTRFSISSSRVVKNNIDENSFSFITGTTATSSSNPLFTNATNDFTLQATSPAIDSGNNSYATTTLDLSGNSRIFNTTVDMGAYEYNSTLSTNNFVLDENEVRLYPNPTTTVLNVKMKSNLKRATIYSVLGATVLETSSKNISTAHLKSGLYIIKIEGENGSIATKRFIKK